MFNKQLALLYPTILCSFQTRSPSKAASMFSGTQDKCATCGKTAYPLEKVGLQDLRMSIFCDIPTYLFNLCPITETVFPLPFPASISSEVAILMHF